MHNPDRAGKYVWCSTSPEPFQAFIPHPLPPNPRLQLNDDDYDLIEKANRALGRLDGATKLLPEPALFLYFYVRKEALVSSQIEGTQSSLSDLLLYENQEVPGVPLADVEEVSSYIAAMQHGLKRLRNGFPLSLRLIREIHEILLSKGRGKEQTPGEFRRTQNWVGGTRPGNAIFVPPPPEEVLTCMGELEKFLNDEPARTPLLIKAALSHVQFETIHPFLDGNGRLGRLLITFLLCAEEALSEPMLYLSLYFKTRRAAYYDLLQKVRMEGDWESWVRFFLRGVEETANQAAEAAKEILQLFEDDRRRLESLGRAAGTALRLHQFAQRQPILSIQNSAKWLKVSIPTVTAAIAHLQKLGILTEKTGRQRNRLFIYKRYLEVLSRGTEPLR